MIRVLVSACLMGQQIRYNGMDAPSDKDILARWQAEGRLVSFCPELAAGFPVPRPPAETVGGDGHLVLLGQATVMEDTGNDVTDLFIEGANRALALAKKSGVKVAVLTDGSPTCGSSYVYNGRFDGGTVPGMGVTAALLEQNGVRVFSEDWIEEAVATVAALEASGSEETA